MHEGAFGCAIAAENIEPFTQYANQALANFDFSQKYLIDLEYDADKITPADILNLANFDNLWGQGIEEPFVLVKGVKVLKDNVQLLKETTLKITVEIDGQNVTLIKFGSNQTEFDNLCSEYGNTTIDIIGRFQKNIWNGNVTPQVLIEDYEIAKKIAYYF